MKNFLLSYYIDNNSPFYVGTTKPMIKPKNQIVAGSDYNTYIIEVENHCGTHVDAPRHFISTGKGISDYNIMELTFEHPLILECPKGPGELIEVEDVSKVDLDGYDCILFKTGFGKYRQANRKMYLTQNPGISPETVQWLRKNHKKVRCLGIDCISISRYGDDEIAKNTHVSAFSENENHGEPLLLIEDMKLDKNFENYDLRNIIVVPWQIKGIDSAPCTVVANIK